MRVIVIGGTGTIGAAVVKALSVRHEVVTVGRQKGAFQVDLASPDSITRLFTANRQLRCGREHGGHRQIRELG